MKTHTNSRLHRVAAFALLVALAAADTALAGSWVTTPPLAGDAARLRIGENDGVVRVAFVEQPSGDLYLARFNAQSWSWSTEFVTQGPIGSTSLALDASGNGFISFTRSTGFNVNTELLLASRTASGWLIETVDATKTYSYDTSIAVDAQGKVHILAKEELDGWLWYWSGYPGGPWTGEVVDADSNPGRYSQLLLDSQDVPHAVYSTWSPKDEPRHAYRTGTGVWTVTTIDSATATYRGLGADIDDTDKVHVAYHHGNTLSDPNTDLFYSQADPIDWSPWSSPEQIFTGGGKYTAACWDVLERFQVATNNLDLTSVYYLRREASGVWGPPEFLASGRVNSDCIDSDGAGSPWIAVHSGDAITGFTITVFTQEPLQTYCTSKPTSLLGCVPSLAASGVPSVSASDGFDISASPTPGGNPGLFLYTTNGAATSPLFTPFGTLCIQTAGMFRIGFQQSPGSFSACDGFYKLDFNAYAATGQDPALVAGARVDLQVWYRDPLNFGAANLTEAGYFTLLP